MPNITEWAAGGLAAIQIGARGNTGTFRGFGNLTVADTGDASGMRRIRGAILGANPVANVNRIRNRGDDGYVATHLFQAEPPDFNLGFEAHDLDAETFLIGGSLYTLGEWTLAVRGQSIPNLQDTITLLTRQATSLESGSTGEGYDNLIICSSKYRPVPGDFAWQGVGGVTLQGSADPVLISPWGEDMADLFDLSDGITIEQFSEFPLTMEAFIGDNTIDDIPLTYAPVTAAKVKSWRTDTGVALTVSSVDVSGKTATLSAAPGTGVPVMVLYETQEL